MAADAGDAATGAFETLTHAERLRRTTRRAARSIWFPLLVFGAVTAGSAAFCTNDPAFGTSPNALNVYWVIAGPSAYLGCLWFYRRRERAAKLRERLEVQRVGAILRHRHVDVADGSVDGREDALGNFHQNAHVLRLHQMLVLRAAVAKVIAELDPLRHSIAKPDQAINYPFFRVVEPVRTTAIEVLHLMRGIPLNRKFGVRNGARLRGEIYRAQTPGQVVEVVDRFFESELQPATAG